MWLVAPQYWFFKIWYSVLGLARLDVGGPEILNSAWGPIALWFQAYGWLASQYWILREKYSVLGLARPIAGGPQMLNSARGHAGCGSRHVAVAPGKRLWLQERGWWLLSI